MKATSPRGKLNKIELCYLTIDNLTYSFNNLPEISDSKTANYNQEPVIGRSSPLITYSHSDTRQISVNIHLFTLSAEDEGENLDFIRACQSAVYPRIGSGGAPFIPPPICTFQCGVQLALEPLCVIIQNYNITFPVDVAWNPETLLPYRVDMSLSLLVVYDSSDLPDAGRIFRSGR